MKKYEMEVRCSRVNESKKEGKRNNNKVLGDLFLSE